MKYVSVREAQELDRRAREEFGIPSLILMEHAGMAVADAAGRMGREFVAAVGPGHNGADGLVAARLLHHRGYRVRLWPLRPLDERVEGEAGVQVRMVRALKLPIVDGPDAGVVIDAIFGIGLNRDVAGPAADMIERINSSGKRVIAVDIPSGLDGDTGRPRGIAVRADGTVTMGFPKVGFRTNEAKEYVGRLIVADIGYPS